MDAIAKKHSDMGAVTSPSEFHCSRTWFDGEKPVKFKKGTAKTSLCVGGMQFQSELQAAKGSDHVKMEPSEKTGETDSLIVLQEPSQKGKHVTHLLK